MGEVRAGVLLVWLLLLALQWAALLWYYSPATATPRPLARPPANKQLEDCDPPPSPPDPQQEVGRRRLQVTSQAWWRHTRSLLTSLEEADSADEALQTLKQGLMSMVDLHRSMEAHFEEVSQAAGAHRWRVQQTAWLQGLVQRRLHSLQHPEDCGRARKLVFWLDHACGLGCQLHFLTFSLALAYALQRTLVVSSQDRPFHKGGWSAAFQPISACHDHSGDNATQWTSLEEMARYQVAYLPGDYALDNGPRSLYPSYVPWGVPFDLARRLRRVHGDPSLWWVGQLLAYVMRPQRHLAVAMETKRHALELGRPLVGVHVRRTDKVAMKDGEFHAVKDYMDKVEEYYEGLAWKGKPAVKRRVFLATDDPSVVREARKLYPRYDILNDQASTQTAAVEARNRSLAALYGIVSDIHLLASSDLIVCTLSSNVCRRALELMQTCQADAADHVVSLQWDYAMHLPRPSFRRYRARLAHVAQGRREIAAQVGDTLLAHTWTNADGRVYMTNERTNASGLVPLYKLDLLVQSMSVPVTSNTL